MNLRLYRYKPKVSEEKKEVILTFFKRLLDADPCDALLLARVLQVLHRHSTLHKVKGMTLVQIQDSLTFFFEKYEQDYIEHVFIGIFAQKFAEKLDDKFYITELGNDAADMLKEYAVVTPKLRVFTQSRCHPLGAIHGKRMSLSVVT